MTSTLRWVKEPEGAWMPGYMKWVKVTLFAVVEATVRARENEINDWMKAEAIWKDRTGNARRSLHTEFVREGMIISVIMMYTIPIFYSVFLENSRFSILAPALDFWAPALLQDVRKALKP